MQDRRGTTKKLPYLWYWTFINISYLFFFFFFWSWKEAQIYFFIEMATSEHIWSIKRKIFKVQKSKIIEK